MTKILIILVFATFIFFGNWKLEIGNFPRLAQGAAPSELKESIDKKSRELQEISGKIKENQKNLEEIQGQGKTLEREVNKINYNIKQADLGIRSSEVIIGKLGLEIDSIKYDIDDAEKSIISKKEVIAKIIQEFQQKDNESFLIVFLKNKSLAESVFEAQNLTNLNNNLSAEIANLTNTKTILADKLKETAGKKVATKTEQENLINKKIILDDLKNDKQIILKQTKNQEKIYQKQLSELEKQQMEISAEIEKIEEELRLKIDPNLLPISRPGVLETPVKQARITQEYGTTQFAYYNYKGKWHNGVDYGAPIGTPVYAAENGAVIGLDNQDKYCPRGAYGKYIIIKHENNLTTLYSHLSLQVIKKGENVERGQLIGYIGKTGWATGSHLHFTVFASQTFNFKASRLCGLMPVGGDLNPLNYL